VSALEKLVGAGALVMALCCALLPLAGAAIGGGFIAGAAPSASSPASPCSPSSPRSSPASGRQDADADRGPHERPRMCSYIAS
jgi:hypothetical protein